MEISTGIIKRPHFILGYGPDGTGKTVFASEAPKCIIVGPEDGSNHINVARAKNINTYTDVVNALTWLLKEKHDFKSVGLDSIDFIEPLLFDQVCTDNKWKTIEDPGFGKGYAVALTYWSVIINLCKKLRDERGMNVIVIAHSQIKTMNDPLQTLGYDRFVLKLNEKASAKWRESVDAVLFMNFEDVIFKANKGDRKGKGGGESVRKIYTVRSAAFDAKNRLGLPPELPLGWKHFSEAADAGQPDSLDNIMAELLEIGKILSPEQQTKMAAAIEKSAGDINSLLKIRNYARSLATNIGDGSGV